MHTPLILAASVAVLSTVVSAERGRPKFYFPKQVKRQFANSTTTSDGTTQSPSSSSSSTSKRDGLGEFLSGILDPSSTDDTGVATVTIHQTTVIAATEASEPTSAADPSPTPANNLVSDLLDPLLGSTGLLPSIIVQPTTSDTATDTIPTSGVKSTDSGTTFGPSGIETSVSTDDTPTTTDSVETLTSGFTGSGTGTAAAATTTKPPLIDLSSIISDLFPDPTTTADASTTSDGASITPTATTDTADSTTTGGLDLSSILSSILDPVTSDLPTLTDLPTGTSDLPTTLPTDLPTDSTLPPITIPTDTATTSPTDSTLPPITTPTDSTLPPITTPTGTPPPPTGNATVTDPPTTIPSGTGSTVIPTTNANSTIATPPPTTQTPPTTLPTSTGSETVPTVTTPPTSGNASATIVPTTSVPVTSLPGTITSAPTPTTEPLTVALPTGTDTATSLWLGSSILIAPSATMSPGENPTAAATAIPSELPKIISAPNTDPIPEGTTLIQIGFKKELNWRWVAESPVTAAQIFQYLPPGLWQGLDLSSNQVKMDSLLPLDTAQSTGWVKTRAMLYFPTDMLDSLQLAIKTPVSALYTNTDFNINDLMSLVDPSVPLIPGGTLSGSDATGTGVVSSPTSKTNGKNGVFDTDQQNTSSGVKGTTAGIAVGAVGAAAAYGAAMFFIARRYKRKKQGHRRSSSIMTHSEMRQSGSPALLGGSAQLMSGGRTSPGESSRDRNSRGSGQSNGNSARTQQISAPMMAENSLGWN